MYIYIVGKRERANLVLGLGRFFYIICISYNTPSSDVAHYMRATHEGA